MRTRMRAAILIVMASACTPAPAPTPGLETPGPDADAAPGGIIAPGARVRVKSRSGTFKPAGTGHTAEVNVTSGKTGTVVQKLGESIRVRFDAQTWDEFPPTGATVELKEFEATLHVSYLEPAR